ncbi:MAG: nuclear transport factor 2 family protein [Chloracidobacterium sp.]|nr:nuclear transport factor 2 family protein [Chloracidobacterium sp.]
MTRKYFVLFFAFILFIAACGGGTTPPNANGGNTASPNSNGANAVAVTTPAPEATTNNAPTLTPVFKAYCDAMVKKDEAALRKIYSSDTIKDFEEQMKADKIKSLMKFLEDDAVSGKLCEVRNEQIKGDEAVAEIRADSYPNGIKVVFVKEAGEWKLTNRSPAIDSVKQTATNPPVANANSNAAKK